FQLSRFDSGMFLLQGEQLGSDASRPLLGKPTPCVGREQELSMLELTLTACIEEPAARALLVTAPPGVGKSRLRHEFLRRLERREQPVLVLLGRGDPMGAGASYCLLGQVLRRLCGIVEGENLEVRRTRLYQRVAQHLPDASAQEVAEFLGELCAIPFPEEGSLRLRAARGDPHFMSTQVGRALLAFLGAECAHQPVLLILEDLHWSDAFTVKLVNELLRGLAEQPFLVLALARPEVKEFFPDLWTRRLQELQLNGLSRKASVRLVREVLGAQVSDTVVQRAVEQSDGNALFLEELIRLVAEGRGEAAPETVLAVLQARLMRMEPGARQVLLAASIFGRTFWSGGVRELLGHSVTDELLEKHLRRLVEQEVIEPQPVSSIPTMTEYRFRHALTRDAAYSLVSHGNRPAGHRMAGVWLERMGESDALVLAAHYQSGQQLERAAHFYTQAVERLFERQELHGTMRCVDAALACGGSGEELNRLRAFQSMVAFWMAQLPRSLELGIPALEGLKAGSPLWCRLMGILFVGSINTGHTQQAARLSELLLRTMPESEALTPYIEAVSIVGAMVALEGERQRAEAFVGHLQELVTEVRTHAPVAHGYSCLLESQYLHFYEARPWRAVMVAEEGSRDFAAVGSERNTVVLQNNSALHLIALGELPAAVALMREALVVLRRAEQHMVAEASLFILSMALAGSPEPGDRQEARALLLEYMERESPFAYMQGMRHALLARMMAADGSWDEAESFARKASVLLAPFRAFLPFARTVLSTILLARGHTAEARREADLGGRELEQMGSAGAYSVGMRLALAEACFAEGD
ncbi:MAG TPA: AAA family ATPase, partial [Archangium sp.]|nr:AAA family ATPase [Archangium sp.]